MITAPKKNTKRDRIRRADLNKLLQTHEPYSISIFIPTHQTGEDVLQGRDARALDVEIRKIRQALESTALKPEEIDARMEPLEILRDDGAFWREQSRGLAIFATRDRLKTFRLPIAFKAEHRLSSNFFILPLIPELSKAQNFYLLALELERIRLYKGSREGIEELSISDLIPERMEQRVGFDYEEKGLQYRSQHQAHGNAGYHGHDEADRDRKDEIERFLRTVDKGLLPVLSDDPYPMVIASQGYLASMYRRVTGYREVVEETLTGNLSEISDKELKERSLQILRPLFEKGRIEKWEHMEELHGTGRATAQMDLILQAGKEGRIDTLFVCPDSEIWGEFKEDSGEISLKSGPAPFSNSLVNLAVLFTLRQGGEVYFCDPEDLPEEADTAMALFRY